MRLREPFNGIKQAQGHFFFHFAFLVGSVMAVTLPAGYIGTTVQLFTAPRENKGLPGLYHLIALIRTVHLVIGCAQLIAFKLEERKHHLLAKVLTCALIFLYQGTILYEQYRMSNLHTELFVGLTQKEDLTTFIIIRWIQVEIMGFYFYLVSASLYLFGVTMRGACGKTNPDYKKDRYKSDALEYYGTDIDWFAFQTVNLLLNAFTAYEVLRVYYGESVTAKKFAGQFSLYEVRLMVFMLVVRIAMFVAMPQIRAENREIIQYSKWYWIPFYLIYVFIFFVCGSGVSDLTYSMIVVDACLFVFQAVYYHFYTAMGAHHHDECKTAETEVGGLQTGDGEMVSLNQTPGESADASQSLTMKKGVSYAYAIEGDEDENEHVGGSDAYRRGSGANKKTPFKFFTSDTMMRPTGANRENEEKDGFDDLKKPDLQIQDDIYSLAYAALVDHKTQPSEGNFLHDLHLNDREASDIYMGALLVVFVQCTVIGLIIHEMLDPDAFHIIAANSFLIIVPRFLSALMMHLNVEPDIRNGIKLMKYAVANPTAFKGVKVAVVDEDGNVVVDEDGHQTYICKYRNVIAPFLLGFFQSTVAIVVEVMVIVFLASLNNLMDIIMKFVAMAAIIKFDDMYAASLFESKVRDAGGKKLQIRCISQDMRSGEGHPIRTSFLLKFLRFVQKSYRTWYVCYGYYFAPFLAVCVTFMITSKGAAAVA